MHPRVRLERLRLKADLINWIGWQRRYASYLEISTPTTGFQFQSIAPEIFRDRQRALYLAPPAFDDGGVVTFRTPDDDCEACLAPLLERRAGFDLVFLDPHHSYSSSRRDLEVALRLLNPEGTLVVHDCHPVRPELVVETPDRLEWCGQTYIAFMDFIRDHQELDGSVVDVDYGCAVVQRMSDAASRRPDVVGQRQLLTTVNYRDWSTYMAERAGLLRLMSVEAFLHRARQRPRTVMTRVYSRCVPLIEATRLEKIVARAGRRLGYFR